LDKDCFFDIVPGTGVRPQVFQQVGEPSGFSPQVMMGIDDLAFGIDDFFLHLIEPFSAAGFMLWHDFLLIAVNSDHPDPWNGGMSG
jgi:hypothetical protein